MDLDAIVEKIRDAIVGDLRKEFTEFKAEVRVLDGFRIAIETMNKRMDSIEQRISRVEARLDETDKRIDTLTLDMNRRIESLTLDMNRRFEDMVKRIESINAELSKIQHQQKA